MAYAIGYAALALALALALCPSSALLRIQNQQQSQNLTRLPARDKLQRFEISRIMPAMPFRPTQDYILVRPIERQHSDTLAVITREKHCRGIVLRVGPGKRDKKGRIIPLDAKPGDTIHFGDGNFDFYPKFYEGNECLRIIQEADICFVELREQQAA